MITTVLLLLGLAWVLRRLDIPLTSNWALIIVGGGLLYTNRYQVERAFSGPSAARSTNEVVLYSTSWCGYCKQARRLLESEGVEFTEFDIESSDEGQSRYMDLVGRQVGVPVLDIYGRVIHGYDKASILDALERQP